MFSIPNSAEVAEDHFPWNNGPLIGPKLPLEA